jgi:DNA-binding MarR family transcriptional regulator
MAEQAGLTEAEVELWRSFYSMRRTLDRALDLQLQRDSHVSASEWEVLMALDDAPGRRLRVKDIAESIGWEKSRVSHLVTRMEKRALVDRTECDTDARVSWISLTTAGRKAVLGALRGHVAALRRYFFDVLEPQDLSTLDSVSSRVVEAIGCGADEDSPASDTSAA